MPEETPAALPPRLDRRTPLVLAVALFMEQMDATVIATSLPAIAVDLGTSPVALKLAVTAYLMALAIFIPVSGFMADRFGASRVFRVAIAVFILGSIGCAFAGSLGGFVAARFVQGMGGAMMTPVARLLLVRSTPRSALVGAMAWLTIPALMGPILGPPLGGFLTTYLTWHWIFWINVPIGLLGILSAGLFLPPDQPEPPRPVDGHGLVLSSCALTGLVFGTAVLSLPALPHWVGLAAAAVGLVAAVAYFRHARRHPAPILDPRMFRYPMFRGAVAGGSLFRVGMGATNFLLPLMLQLGFGLTPFQSGLVTFVAAAGALTSKFGAERLFRGLGFRRVLATGSLLGAGFIALNATFGPTTPVLVISSLLLVGGVVRSLTFTGINALAFADVEPEDMSQATAINAVAQQVSLAAGVALAGGVLELAAAGGPLALADFHLAFLVVAFVSAGAMLPFARLPADAGAAVSGHRPRGARGS